VTPSGQLLHLLRRYNWPLMLGLAGVMVLLLLAFVGPYLAPYDPQEVFSGVIVEGRRLPPYPPSPQFPLGTDRRGRDLVSGLLAGGRLTLLFTTVAVGIGAVLALPLGLVAGWREGLAGMLASVYGSMSGAIPQMVVVGILLNSVTSGVRDRPRLIPLALAAVVVGVVAGLRLAATVRRLARSIRSEPYIEAVISTGASMWRILWRHLLPNIAPALANVLLLEYAATLRLLAALAVFNVSVVPFFRVEAPWYPFEQYLPAYPEWTSYMSTSNMTSTYWLILFPGLAVAFTILTCHLLAAGLQRRWSLKSR